MDYREEYYTVNGIRLHVVEAGEANAPVLLLLHGFPEFWYGWQKQLDYFSQQGYRVVAPDQRGYNLSSKPDGLRSYIVEHLVADTVALIRTLTNEQVIVAGHDWGGVVAWATATKHPELVRKLITLNMPHPIVMAQHVRREPRQTIKSMYIGFFQVPALPELLLKSFNYRYLQNALAKTAKRGAFTEAELALYREAWSQPGALTGTLNWYRAFRHSQFQYTPVAVPTFIIWGKRDQFLRHQMAADSLKRCVNGRLLYLENATHWLHHEQPDLVNESMLTFIKE